MSRYRGALLLGALVFALLTGALGGWLVAWGTGRTATVTVDPCYVYYGRQETEQYRCEGYWPRGGHLANGPVLGVPIAAKATVIDPQNRQELGYVLSPDSYDHSAVAIINGDAAVVVPTSQLILGPVSAGALLACLGGLFVARRTARPPVDVATSA